MKTLLKRWSLWVIIGVYFCVIIGLLVIIPRFTNLYFVTFWLNGIRFVQTFILYVIAIFSGIMAIYVFREHQENGTELIIFAKGISRKKIILGKFSSFLTFGLIFSLLTSLSGLFCYSLPHVNNRAVNNLVLALLVGNIVSFLFFGGTGIIFSLFFNKVIVVTLNILLIIASVIFTSAYSASKVAPLDFLTQDSKYSIISESTVNKDQQNITQTSFIVQPTEGKNFFQLLKSMNLDEQKNIWNEAEQKSQISLFSSLSLIDQLSNVFLIGGLNDVYLTSGSQRGIGSKKNIYYTIKDSFIHHNTQSVKNATDDNIENWSLFNSEKNNFPYVMLDPSSFTRKDTKEWAELNKTVSLLNPETIRQYLEKSQKIFTNTFLVYPSVPSRYQTIFNNYGDIYNYYSNDGINRHGYLAGYTFSGRESSKNYIPVDSYVTNHLTKFEYDFFSWLLANLLFSNGIFNNLLYLNNNEWKFDFQKDPTAEIDQWNKNLIVKIFIQECQKYAHELKLNKQLDYVFEELKFKQFIVNQLTGKNGIENYNIQYNFYSTQSTTHIQKILWNDYFRFCYLPIYKLFTIKNYDDMSLFAKDGFINHGNTLPFSVINTDKKNFFNRFLTGKINPEQDYTKDVLPVYTGNLIPNNSIKNDLQVYSIENTEPEQNPVQIDNTYGFFSPLGLRASSLVSSFCHEINYYFYSPETNSWTKSFRNSLSMSSQNMIIAQRGLFIYSAINRITPIDSMIRMIFITLILYSISFTKYLRYDFN